MKLLVINGPNLNFLGIRKQNVYGKEDYEFLLNKIKDKELECGISIEVFQSNYEGAIIDKIQESYFDDTKGIVINPGAFTHYSYAIRDALESIPFKKVEIHISDIKKREAFRQLSVTSEVCDKQIMGKGLDGYIEAIDWLILKINEEIC
ncbi:MAG: type II 3-dehydroquinate dehydratase [Lachnospiraceae bacterium]